MQRYKIRCNDCDPKITPHENGKWVRWGDVERLRAELAECKRDAERYRFLRAHWDHLATNTCYENGEYHVIAIDLLEQRNIPLNLETLDAEIDAALAADGETK